MRSTVPPVCTIVCLTYNQSKYVEDALDSIFAQTYRNIEVIIVDDGSIDNTAEVIERKIQESPFPCKFITQENTGNVASNFNTALQYVNSPFLTFLSLDDVLCKKAIQNRMSKVINSEKVAFVADTKIDEIDESGKLISTGTPMEISRMDCSSAEALLECEYSTLGSFYIQSAIFRSCIVEEVQGFDDDLLGDDIILRTKIFRLMSVRTDLEFDLVDQAGVKYRKHGENLHLQTDRQIRTILQWKERYFPDRSLPTMGVAWVRHWFIEARLNGREKEIEELSKLDREVQKITLETPRTWKYRRRYLKNRLKRLFGTAI